MNELLPPNLSDEALASLESAVQDPHNAAAVELCYRTGARSVTGILAAMIVSEPEDLPRILELVRLAIADAREVCAASARTHGLTLVK